MTYLLLHLSSILLILLTLVFASAILRDRRAPGAALLWLALILFVPYIGILAFMVVGRRKLRQDDQTVATSPELWARPGNHQSQFNDIQTFSDGVLAFQEIETALQGAQTSILFETFIFKWDETGQRIFAILCAKAQSDVQVRLLLDGFGQLMGSRIAGRVPAELRDRFQIAIFSPALSSFFRGSVNLRNHRKLVVIDSQRAFVGGMNVASEYMGPTPRPDRWQDFVFSLTGEVVSSLTDVFQADWRMATGRDVKFSRVDHKTAPSTRQAVCTPSGPNLPYDPIYDSLLWQICRAQSKIWIATPYFVPDEALIKVLAIAAMGGIDVQIILPAHSNHPMTDLARGSALRDLQRAGVRVLYFPRMIHAKLVMIDDDRALVGSANMDIRSLFVNYELGLWIKDRPFVDDLAERFQGLAQQCQKGTEPCGSIREMTEGLARILSPML